MIIWLEFTLKDSSIYIIVNTMNIYDWINETHISNNITNISNIDGIQARMNQDIRESRKTYEFAKAYAGRTF